MCSTLLLRQPCVLSFPSLISPLFFFFFFNDTATTEIYTLSLHDALPITAPFAPQSSWQIWLTDDQRFAERRDRKSTRLNSSHRCISYAVFCLKKKKKKYSQLRYIKTLELATTSRNT